MLNCERRIKSDLNESIQSLIVEPACAESLSIASGKFCETICWFQYFTHEQFFWFDLVTLHLWKLSEKRRSLFFSSQLLIDDLIACDSCWCIQGYNIYPLISRAGSISWMAESYLQIMIKGKTAISSALLLLLFWSRIHQGLHVFKSSL